jgi:hypothetical protein
MKQGQTTERGSTARVGGNPFLERLTWRLLRFLRVMYILRFRMRVAITWHPTKRRDRCLAPDFGSARAQRGVLR